MLGAAGSVISVNYVGGEDPLAGLYSTLSAAPSPDEGIWGYAPCLVEWFVYFYTIRSIY
jgi:hypothetical protein